MNLTDLDALAKGLAPVVARLVEAATGPLLNRIDALEKELADRPQPQDGKDADPAVIERLVAEAVAAIPPAKDGDPGKDADPETIKAMVAEAFAALPAPKDGESVDPASVKAMVAEAVAELPTPEDGKSLTTEDVAPLIADEVAKAIAALPTSKDGQDGKDADPEITRDLVQELLAEAVSALPTPKDGEPPSAEQIAGAVREHLTAHPPANGKDGDPGKDGVGLAGALIDRSGGLVVTLTDGSQRELGIVVGRDAEPGQPGKDGADGRDGLGFEDMDLTFDGERKLIATFTRGEVSKAVEVEFPVTLHRGVYKPEAAYVRGDSVTWAGSSWIARRDAAPGEKPEASDAWLLSVKRGRDGKDGSPGQKGDPGAKGDPGRSH